MDKGELQGLLKRLCKVMWESNVTNPITYVTQISYLLFLKMMEEWEAEAESTASATNNGRRSFFKDKYEALRWSRLTSDPDNERMLKTLRDLLPELAEHPDLSQAARQIFQGAAVVIPNGAALRRAVDIISSVSFIAQDADVKGDLFEILVSDLGSQKRAAQFRTPRHLIRVITAMVDPKIGETVCDPACGSGGFLIAAYEHILTANSGQDFIREDLRPDGTAWKRGIGDKLTRAQWDFLQSGCLHGFESDNDIIRLAGMNAVLHQFDASPIIHRDSICGSEERWDETQFDVIITNPPFSGAVARDTVKRSLRVETGSKYLLFLALCLRSLRQGGRCGIILPNGALFGDTDAHKELKRRLLDELDLQAVVILPSGMFEPYTPNPTAFLVFAKTGKSTESIWFYRVEGDGSSLKKARKFGPQYRNDFPDLLAKWPERKEEPGQAWQVSAEVIREKGYNLTLSGLGLIAPETVEHEPPEEILEVIAEKQERIAQIISELRTILETNNRGTV